MQPINPSNLSPEQKDELILQLFDHIATLSNEIKELKAQLAKNSRNSSKPPSSDGYGKPKPKSRRQKSTKRSGGQTGHKGNTLKQVEHPDNIIEHPVTACRGCGFDLSDLHTESIERRQVFDIPPMKIQVSEHRSDIKTCPCCASRNKGVFPDDVTQPVQYGPELQAVASYLSQYQMVPFKRLQELFNDLYQIPLSQGTLDSILDRGHAHLLEFEQQAKQVVISSELAHFDESGMRVDKQLHWLHVASTDQVTCYEIHPQRGAPAMEAMGILTEFEGYAVHDHWASYYGFDVYHVLCNAHHLRELIHALEQHDQQWAAKLIDCLLEAKTETEKARAAGKTALSHKRIKYYDERYSRILREGREQLPIIQAPKLKKRGRVKQHKVKNLHDRLVFHKHETLAFIYDLTVPFDNNLAERDVRMAKVKQKISGCFRSEHGAHRFCGFRGYISTARKQGRNILDSLRDAFCGRPFHPASA